MRITLLGTGTSHGVPMLDCMLNGFSRCEHRICEKALTDPRYRRTRASILLQEAGFAALIDTSQDFRQQMLENHVERLDAVLFTHAHADHIYGLPDIRSYCAQQRAPIDVYASSETLGSLHEAFHYIFEPNGYVGGGIPSLTEHTLDASCEIGPMNILPVPVIHGPLNGCQGYRIESADLVVAYIPDVKTIPDASLAQLQGLDLLILNCLRPRPHGSHLSLDESLAYATALAPRRCLFTHMTHDIDPDVHSALLPSWAAFAHDGQIVEL
ncbi:MAG: MBL fold metallo-hydrolase [Chloroflexi bacterium]|nr:MBL fold metallo-hydrolase [Chloroflexota bacterium]